MQTAEADALINNILRFIDDGGNISVVFAQTASALQMPVTRSAKPRNITTPPTPAALAAANSLLLAAASHPSMPKRSSKPQKRAASGRKASRSY